jgi:hypothetical protein
MREGDKVKDKVEDKVNWLNSRRALQCVSEIARRSGFNPEGIASSSPGLRHSGEQIQSLRQL